MDRNYKPFSMIELPSSLHELKINKNRNKLEFYILRNCSAVSSAV